MLHPQHQSTGFQEKFVHDDALRFQTATNIAKQAGVLLGRKLGQSEQEAVSLGKLLVRADLSDPGDAHLHQAMKEVTTYMKIRRCCKERSPFLLETW